MKQRFSSLDVKVIARELNSTLPSLRISNVYDLSSRIFLFKCAKPGTKAQLLVDSGFRCHLTSFQRTANPTPSAFVSRLRKVLKSRRITAVSQLGTDRVIEITFSDGQYRLFLEFFAAGNIVLTDSELNVLALLRQVSEGNEDVDVRIGGKYVLDAKQNYHGVQAPTKERLREVLQNHIAKVKAIQESGGKRAKKQKAVDELKRAVSSGFSEYPVHLLEHVFTVCNYNATQKPEDVLQSEEALNELLSVLNCASDLFRSFDKFDLAKGYIVAKIKGPSTKSTPEDTHEPIQRDMLRYEDFHPFRPSQYESDPDIRILEVDGFNKTVDQFYSSLESQKLESRLTEKEEVARKKLENARNEHAKRLGALQQVQELHVRKAQAIEANTHRVEEATAAVNGLIGQGMDWVDIGKLIENEQNRSNSVAQMIKLPLKLYENTVTLLLDEPGQDDESDDDVDKTDSEYDSDDEELAASNAKSTESKDKRLAIDIDLGISAWANARQYYDQKKTAAVKEQKTMQASTKALQSMSKKTEADLKKGLKQEKAALRLSRKLFWFEKFLYFISSDGYLVLGGKDAQQNELLYRRYLKKGDIYVHADLQGASSVIVKNNPSTPDAPIPPSTLSQAGTLTVCTSSAWDSKAVMAAWWVNADQVSKTAPTGEYIKTGGFMIRGKKNFLPPAQLILGFGIIWLISEESRANHGKHRLERTESMLSGEAEFLAADARGLSIEDEVSDTTTSQWIGGPVVSDVEDAGQAAEEVEEHENTTQDQTEDTDVDEDASRNASDTENHRSNPLQSDNATDRRKSDLSSVSTDEDEHEGQDEEDGENEIEGINEVQSSSEKVQGKRPQNEAGPKATNGSTPKKLKPKRGANTKAKRAAREKYALQSDEERELAMSLLGSTKGEKKREAEEASRAAREEKSKADKERRRAQHDRAAEAERKRMEKLEKQKGGDNNADDTLGNEDEDGVDAEQLEQERNELLNIDLLVPYPEPGDELIAAVPVVAPWTAMARNKYKVKLQPGSLKKGKALKEIIGNWSNLASKGPKVIDESNRDKEKVWVREIDCIKAWRVEEIVGVVPVKGVRIVHGGAGSAAGGGGGKGKGSSARGGKGSKRR